MSPCIVERSTGCVAKAWPLCLLFELLMTVWGSQEKKGSSVTGLGI